MIRLRLAFACLLAAPAAALADRSHLYDDNDVVAIDGTIAAIHWINPQVHLTLETRAEDGRAERWEVEATSRNALERWGVGEGWFAVGDAIRVSGPRSRLERNAMLGATARLPDGRQVLLSPTVAARLGLAADTGVAGLFPPPRADAGAPPSSARGIFRVWTPRGLLEADPQRLPLTARAREIARAYKPLEDDPARRCIPPGMPAMLATAYPIELLDRGDQILMRYEEWDGMRTIYMNPRNGPPTQESSPHGVSFGRWEGATLAIFTTYIRYPYFDDVGTPQSAAVTVLERYTPSADGTRLESVVRVTDGASFSTPVVLQGFMAFEAAERIKPYNCTITLR